MVRFLRISFYRVLFIPPVLLWFIMALASEVFQWASERLDAARTLLEELVMTPIIDRMWNRKPTQQNPEPAS